MEKKNKEKKQKNKINKEKLVRNLKSFGKTTSAALISGVSGVAVIFAISGLVDLGVDHSRGYETIFGYTFGSNHIETQLSEEKMYYVHEKEIEDLTLPINCNSAILKNDGYIPEGFQKTSDTECVYPGIIKLQILSEKKYLDGWENKGYYVPNKSDKLFYGIDKNANYYVLDYEDKALNNSDIYIDQLGVISDETFNELNINTRTIGLLMNKDYSYEELGQELALKK